MTENKVKPDSVPPMTCQQMPWLSKDIQHARDAIEYLACRINLAYESGELDAADVIDGELEHLYEFMETALGDLEEDGIELNSRTDPSGYRNRHLRTQVGDSVDVEHGPIEILAACYEEAFVRRRPPFGLETMEDKISYLRGPLTTVMASMKIERMNTSLTPPGMPTRTLAGKRRGSDLAEIPFTNTPYCAPRQCCAVIPAAASPRSLQVMTAFARWAMPARWGQTVTHIIWMISTTLMI